MREKPAWSRIPFALIMLATAGFAAVAGMHAQTSSATALSQRQKALHVLNRLGFGARPGDVDRVLAIGLDRYVEQQLHPERIADGQVDTKIASLPILKMSDEELFQKFTKPMIEARRERKLAAAKGGEDVDEAEVKRMRTARSERPRRVIEELSVARILRATDSERQLNEVMVDFWMNHFNIFAGKGYDRVGIVSFERDVVRPRIWGSFEELLMATAKSPAMLFYLDNVRSVADPQHRGSTATMQGTSARRGARFGSNRTRIAEPSIDRKLARKGGLNENYARELLELHTLGVEGGYTQKDVTELARLLTGWSMQRPGVGSGFAFHARMHDGGAKTVLGHQFAPNGGISEGETIIRELARHPSTARFIARKLCQRLVADDPPAALVERVASRFLATNGNLRETVKAVVTSPEFFDSRYYRAKIKTPFEYVVSAIRAVGGTTDGRMVALTLREMGQPLYFCQPPTGYSDLAAPWVNSGALLARLNFALALASGKYPGSRIDFNRLGQERVLPARVADAQRVPSDVSPGAAITALEDSLVGGELSAESRQTIEARLHGDATVTADSRVQTIAGLILGSPEFQRQ